MACKLTVGLSRKSGETNLGSGDAHINVEMEVDPNLVATPGQLKEQLRQLFALARMSLAEASCSGR